MQGVWPQPRPDHRHSTGRHDGDWTVHLGDQEAPRLRDRAMRHALLHGIAQVQDDFRSPVGANRLGDRASVRRLVHAPQPIHDAL